MEAMLLNSSTVALDASQLSPSSSSKHNVCASNIIAPHGDALFDLLDSFV
jgi:hypothetical protein